MREYKFILDCIFLDEFDTKKTKNFFSITDYIQNVDWLFSIKTGTYLCVVGDGEDWGNLFGGKECHINNGILSYTTYFVLFKDDRRLPLQIIDSPMWNSQSRNKVWAQIENDDIGRAEIEIDMNGNFTYIEDEYDD